MQFDRLSASPSDLRLDLSGGGSSPRVDALEWIAGERPPRRAAQQREIELLHREVLELIHQHSAEVALVEPRDRWDAEEALRMPQNVVVVELIRLLTRTLDLLSQSALRPRTLLLNGDQHLGV